MSESIEIQYLKDVLGIRNFVMPVDQIAPPVPPDVVIYYDASKVFVQASTEPTDIEKALLKRMLTAIQVTDFVFADALFVPMDSMPRVEVYGLHEMANGGANAAELKKKVWSDLQVFSQAMKGGLAE